MSDIIKRLDEIRDRFSDEVFLKNKGLSNEVGIHIFCYEPSAEMTVRSYFNELRSNNNTFRFVASALTISTLCFCPPESFWICFFFIKQIYK